MNSKYGLRIPKVDFTIFQEHYTFRELKRKFYIQNAQGFLEEDIDKETNIFIDEFDLNDASEPHFFDTPPERVEKELLNDFLMPVLYITESNYGLTVQNEYEHIIESSETVLIRLKEKHLDFLSDVEKRIKDSKHLTGGFKAPLLKSLKSLQLFVDKHIDLTHTKSPSENKISMNLNKKDIISLLLYLNEKKLFSEEKLVQDEIAEILSIHFKYKVGKGAHKIMDKRSASKEVSRVLNSANESDELPKRFSDYKVVFKQILDAHKESD